MSAYSKQLLSASTNGRGVKVAATSIGSGTTIHTNPGSVIDLVTLFVVNSDTVDRVLTLGWGGTTSPDDLIPVTVKPNSGLVLVTADLLIGTALVVKAAGDAANVLILFGYINRIT